MNDSINKSDVKTITVHVNDDVYEVKNVPNSVTNIALAPDGTIKDALTGIIYTGVKVNE